VSFCTGSFSNLASGGVGGLAERVRARGQAPSQCRSTRDLPVFLIGGDLSNDGKDHADRIGDFAI
jgi:hypothetical protein